MTVKKRASFEALFFCDFLVPFNCWTFLIVGFLAAQKKAPIIKIGAFEFGRRN